jgi:ketosteroid isomerase-like protein
MRRNPLQPPSLRLSACASRCFDVTIGSLHFNIGSNPMPHLFATPQDAEDAFYDAIDEQDLNAMMEVWENSDEVVCLLPMQSLVQGAAQVRGAWQPLLNGEIKVDIEVHHIHWLESGDIAIHYLQEKVKIEGQPQQQAPLYASNVYRKSGNGWTMILHQNSPTPPPPGMIPGMQMPD